MTEKTEFAKRLIELQTEKKVTMADIERETGIRRSNIRDWINYGMMPNTKTLIKLCKYFDISADWLLGLSNFRRIKK